MRQRDTLMGKLMLRAQLRVVASEENQIVSPAGIRGPVGITFRA
jgi:hypothetical protein